MEFAEVRRRLEKLDTACICDARKSIRVVSAEIRPLVLGMKLVGRARTVKCHNDFLSVLQSLGDAGEGDVLVVDGQGGERALAGEIFATESMRRSLAGLVIDGACRDTRLLREMRIPVYSRSITPNAGTATQPGEKQVPATVGGVVINPGDIVFGDDDGLIVSTLEELEELIPVAEDIQQREARVLERIQSGQSLFEILDMLACTGSPARK